MFAWWGRTVYRYRFIVIAVMVALCIGGGIFGMSLGQHVTQSGFYDDGSQSVKASLIADGAYGRDTSGHIVAIYTAPDGKLWVHVSANPDYGMATIWDADILIWAASQIVEARDAGIRPSRLMQATPYEILRFIGRGTSRRDYQRLKAALDRLQTTSVATSIRETTGRRWSRPPAARPAAGPAGAPGWPRAARTPRPGHPA